MASVIALQFQCHQADRVSRIARQRLTEPLGSPQLEAALTGFIFS